MNNLENYKLKQYLKNQQSDLLGTIEKRGLSNAKLTRTIKYNFKLMLDYLTGTRPKKTNDIWIRLYLSDLLRIREVLNTDKDKRLLEAINKIIDRETK